ncbi:MAG: type 4a pilus biogenesis protein PilO [Deltaproteobacteria bacterium]|nr:type 4a pilus biogenesis protein PilO [Deltaproteobacteria bacterium]
MKQLMLEIVRQKWRFLSIILILLLLNVALIFVVSTYQLPILADLQTKWSSLRRSSAGTGQMDPAALYQQASADLEKVKGKIPEKKQFARVLSELLEAAASSGVEVGAISYKPQLIKEEALLSYQVALSVSGGYAAVKSYLADLQGNPELLVVDAVSFSNSDPFVENVVMALRITVYLREGA